MLKNTLLTRIVEKNCCTKETRKIENEMEYIEHISYEMKAALIEKNHGVKIPRKPSSTTNLQNQKLLTK